MMDDNNSIFLDEIGQNEPQENEGHNEFQALNDWVQSSDGMVANKALNPSMMGEFQFSMRQWGQYFKPILVRTLWVTFLFILVGQLYYLFFIVPAQPVASPMPLSIAIEQIKEDLPATPKPPHFQ